MVVFNKVSAKNLIQCLFKLNTKKGKKSKLEKIFLKVSYQVWRKKRFLFLETFIFFVNNSKPFVNFKNLKLKGSSLTIPYYIDKNKQIRIALCWVFSSSFKVRYLNNLNNFFLENKFQNEDVKERRKKFHEMANQYKVFAHNRWF